MVLALVSTAAAAESSAKPQLGMNLSGPADWNTELPFVDVFRLSRSWISQKQGESWGKGPELKLDEKGWIKQLDEGCFAETPLCTINTGHYPSGRYTVLYDGQGEININPGNIVERQPGKMLVQIDASRGGFFLQLKKTDPNDYVRNIRVIMPGFESTYEKEPFHPVFLEHWQGMAAFRFMDWQQTNGSKIVTWNDRPKMDDATWTVKGIPVEMMVDLCNRQKTDAWVCMPHAADDEFVRNFAQQVKEKLDPSLKVYVEYSNEVWNGMFESQRYAQRKAKELNLGPADRPWEGACLYYGRRSLEMFKIWRDVFGDQGNRVVRTLAWQAAADRYWLDGMLLANVDTKNVDALSIAPYMSMNLSPQSKPSSDEVASWSVDQVLDYVHNTALPQSEKWIQNSADVAKKYGLKLTCYEAGQHLVGVGGGENNDKLTALLHQANAHPRMGEAYAKYFKAWEAAGGDLLCNFSSVSNWSKWGSWGLVEYYDQGPKDSPKLKATLDWGKSLGQKVSLEEPQVK